MKGLLHTVCEPEGDGPYPTVLALHGWGASGFDLLGLAPLLGGGRFLFLCPQGPVEVPTGEGAKGYGWFNFNPGVPPDPEEFKQAEDKIRDFLALAKGRYPVDEKKVLLLGFSMGGVLAFSMALRSPEEFAGLCALSTWLPPPLVDGLEPGPALERLPILIQHGTEDPLIPFDRARESRERLRALNAQVVFREYPMGHELGPDSLRDLNRWVEDKIFSQIVLA